MTLSDAYKKYMNDEITYDSFCLVLEKKEKLTDTQKQLYVSANKKHNEERGKDFSWVEKNYLIYNNSNNEIIDWQIGHDWIDKDHKLFYQQNCLWGEILHKKDYAIFRWNLTKEEAENILLNLRCKK